MDIGTYLSAVRRGWLVIVISTVALTALAAVYTVRATPQYLATSSMFFSVVGGDSVTQLLQGSTFTQNQVRSYALLAETPAVLGPVVESLDLDTTPEQLAFQVSTESPADTVVLDIQVIDSDPEEAARIANSISSQLAVEVARLSTGPSAGANALAVKATTIAEATVPTKPTSPSWSKNLVLGFLAGAALGCAIAILRELFDTRVRSEDVARTITDVPVVGAISDDPDVAKNAIALTTGGGARGEEFRRLRSNLDFLNVDNQIHSVVITSPAPNEGKSLIAVNLAAAMAQDRKVILVDADLRNPTVASLTGLENAVGLSTVLSGRISVASATQRWGRSSLDVLTAGETPPNPAEMLNSEAMSHLLHYLVTHYDVVLFDSAPILPVSDSTILAQKSDGAIVVVNARHTTKHALGQAMNHLEKAGATCLGIVMNQTEATTSRYYGTYATAAMSSSPDSPPTMPSSSAQESGVSASALESDEASSVAEGR